jgi:hypothetical protein
LLSKADHRPDTALCTDLPRKNINEEGTEFYHRNVTVYMPPETTEFFPTVFSNLAIPPNEFAISQIDEL